MKTWVKINRLNHGEILMIIPDGRDIAFRVRRESQVRFYALHEWSKQWVKEERYDLDKCPLMKISEYLDMRLQAMAELN